ncbi:EamA/RhaT family transporter, partial [Pseudomonas sp. MWU13-2625]
VAFLGKASSALQIAGALLTIFAVYIGSIKPPEKVAPVTEAA